jgi:uracil-DNA glycosylase
MSCADKVPPSVNDWDSLLEWESRKPYWTALQSFVATERSNQDVYPPDDEVFAALEATPLADTKVVILGQDPYHGAGQASGLAFSVPRGVKIPRSLRNIYKELNEDCDVLTPDHGNLEVWAERGVLLLNTTLTVRGGDAGSHWGRGWEAFTDAVICLVDAKADAVVFILWGDYARRKKELIMAPRHTVIESSHPSPQSARRGCPPFFGSKPFSRADSALRASGREGIDWTLPDCPALA